MELENYDELETKAEMAYLSNYVLHNFKRKGEKRHEKHERLFNKIAEEYKTELLKHHPEKAEEINDIEDYLIRQCDHLTEQHEREHIAELLATLLQSTTMDSAEFRERFLSIFKV